MKNELGENLLNGELSTSTTATCEFELLRTSCCEECFDEEISTLPMGNNN